MWLESILQERFGHQFILENANGLLALYLSGQEGNILFDRLEDAFLKSSSEIPYTCWNAVAEGWHSALNANLPTPGVAELPSPLIEQLDGRYVIHYDIIGLTYWMLARVEEIGRRDLDSHSRFPATSSHAFKYGYLDRPVVDEWLHILSQVIQRQWPEISLRIHQSSLNVSHDVDSPFQYLFMSPKNIGRQVLGDVLKRGNPKIGLNRFLKWCFVKAGNFDNDPFNTFDWIMDVSDQYGLTSTFYFVCGRTDAQRDTDYEIECPAIRAIMRRIHERDHEIGLHPSYNTYKRLDAIVDEASRLRSVCAEEGIEQTEWGVRMHYLRWEQPTTMRVLEAAGMSYDSTLSYADHAGFRCGTCFEFPGFDAVVGKTLNLRIRPLIAMECAVLGDMYQNLSYEDALTYLKILKQRCYAVGGSFSLLWHNSELLDPGMRSLYVQLLRHGH